MTYLDPDHIRSVPRARCARAVAIPVPLAGRRRAACFAACIVALATTLVLPSSARAGWPLEKAAPVALGFGGTYAASDGTSTHRGVDLAAPAGSAVRSPLSGRVSFAGRVPGIGGGTVLAVTIATADGSLTLLPLSSAEVRAGTELAEGDAVGVLAGTGDPSSSAAHLHVGARKGDLYVDPLSLIEAPAPALRDAPKPPEPSPVVHGEPAQGLGGEAAALQGQPAARAAAVAPSGVSAVQPAGASAISPGAVGVQSPVSAMAPGANVAPGVSVAGAVEPPAMSGSTMEAVSEAFSAAMGGTSRERSGGGSLAGAIVEWVLGMAARGLQAGARVLAGVLLALAALWPIWRNERRKGTSQLSVRPVGDDVAAVTGR